jgi:ferredoxin
MNDNPSAAETPPPVRLHVDRNRCQGHTRCLALAPELFEIDALGSAREIGDGLVPPGLAEKARLAEANCPEFAIAIVEVNTP